MTEVEKMMAMLQAQQAKEQEQAVEQENTGGDWFNWKESADYLKFEIGGEYTFRMCFPASEVGRTNWGIHKIEHKFYGKTFADVTCLASEYIDGNKGYDKCRCCNATQDMYKNIKNPLDEEMYKMFRRQINGYAMVYMTGDSVNPENVGKFKFIRYGKGIKADLKRDINGINERAKGKQSKVCKAKISGGAFALVNGYDCEIMVDQTTENGRTWPVYNVTWDREPTTVPITQTEVNQACQDIRFDELYTISTKEEIEEFYTKYILHYDDLKSDKEEDETPVMPPAPKFVPADPATTFVPADTTPTTTPDVTTPDVTTPAIGEVDVLAILNKIKNQGK